VTAFDNRLRQPLAQALAPLRGSDWWPLLDLWQCSLEGKALMAAVDARVTAGAVVYPSGVFKALALTPRSGTRVLILGQDPYHGAGQAEGLAFSVPAGVRCPPSLRNILKELQRDLGVPMPPPGVTSLVPWAQQGVLLLNTSLTVEDDQAGAHSRLGWQALTDAIVSDLVEAGEPKVLMLWGSHAQARLDAWASRPAALKRHLALRCNHPSPLSALRGPQPFIGCGHFGQANRWLQTQGKAAVDWRLALP
jgi:uracil-DNA glycosylase